MANGQIEVIDLCIVGAYMVLMVIVGILVAGKVKNTDDFYVAGRSLGPLVLMATVCATTLGGSAMLGRAGLAYTNGIKCIVTAVPYTIGMFIFSGVAGRIQKIGHKHGIRSIPDLFGRRFGKTAKCVLSAMTAFSMMGTVAAQITATATIIKMLGGNTGISYEAGALIATVIFLLYTAASGMIGVVMTDVIQFTVLVAFVYVMVPVAGFNAVGGIGNFLSAVDKSYLIPHINGSILGDIVTYFAFTMAAAEMWQRAFAAKDGKSARRGLFLGTLVYAISITLVLLMGLLAQQILPNVVGEYGSQDAVIPAMAVKLLPAGLTGLALSGIISIMMSTSDSYLLVSVQTLVNDIGTTVRPGMTDRDEIRLSRILSVLLAFGAFIIALYIKSAYDALSFAWAFYAAAAGLPAIAALLWKKATNAGVLAGMIGGFAVTVGWKLLGQPFGLGATVPGIIVCAVALVTVSLATCKKHPTPYFDGSAE